MSVLRMAIYFVAATFLAGTFVLIALLAPVGLDNATGMIGSAVGGGLLAIPVAYILANKISGHMT